MIDKNRIIEFEKRREKNRKECSDGPIVTDERKKTFQLMTLEHSFFPELNNEEGVLKDVVDVWVFSVHLFSNKSFSC